MYLYTYIYMYIDNVPKYIDKNNKWHQYKYCIILNANCPVSYFDV